MVRAPPGGGGGGGGALSTSLEKVTMVEENLGQKYYELKIPAQTFRSITFVAVESGSLPFSVDKPKAVITSTSQNEV